MKTPTTFGELEQAAQLPFHEGNSLISRAKKALVESWGASIYPNWGHGYLHSSDHTAALRILLGREPTFRETYDSWHGGSKNIDAARIKEGGGGRPAEWDSMTAEGKLYAVLVHRYGINRGSKILDGMKDPDKAATQALLDEWSGGPVPPPAPPPLPPVEPPPPPPAPPVQLDYKSLLVVLRGDLAAALEKVDAALRTRP